MIFWFEFFGVEQVLKKTPCKSQKRELKCSTTELQVRADLVGFEPTTSPLSTERLYA